MQPIIDMTKQYAKWKADFPKLCSNERASLERKRLNYSLAAQMQNYHSVITSGCHKVELINCVVV